MKNKIAVIVGSSGCVFDDLEKLNMVLPNREDYTVFTVNFASMLPIKPNYVCAIHGDYIETYKRIAEIKAEEFGWGKDFYSISTYGNADIIEDELGVSGTSGRFAVDMAKSMGFNKIILCGIPIDGSKRFYGDIYHNYGPMINEIEWTSQDSNIVRSFSGNTKQLLGEPIEDWLRGGIL